MLSATISSPDDTTTKTRHQRNASRIKAAGLHVDVAELTGPSGPARPRPDLLHLVADLGQAELHLGQLEVERKVLVFVILTVLVQGSCSLLVALRRPSLVTC